MITGSFEQLKVGDTFAGIPGLEWRFVARVPDEVAEYWVAILFTESVITRRGFTPETTKVSDWEAGLGVVVGQVDAYPGSKRLNMIHKSGRRDDFRLYLSTREQKMVELPHGSSKG